MTFRDTVQIHAPSINRLNVYPVPDGDTGTNMARTLDAVVAELDQAAPELDATCAAISHGSLMGARGNSGVILSQILRGFAASMVGAGEASGAKVADALRAASTAAYQAVLKPIEGTILTVARAAADGAHEAAEQGGSLAAVLRSARRAARSALERTPEQLQVLKDAGVVDAGGAGFVLLLDAALHVVDGEPLPQPDDSSGPTLEQLDAVAHRHAGRAGEIDVTELRYEVMYLLDLDDQSIDAFRAAWAAIGDSIVVVGGDGLWNCHVHTNDIGGAIEAALDQGGRPKRIRVTDLFDEVADEHAAREAEMHRPGPSPSLPPVTCAVVAVASGDGIVELFGNLGVQGVVTGGQTMNPSTAELLAAVEAVNADQVVVLPNNSNIIAVAEQLDGLTSKRVSVVRTRTMPEALAALVVYDPEVDASINADDMTAAAESVATGELTQAVRDTNTTAGEVRTGDWIGITRAGGVVTIASSLEEAAIGLLTHLVTPEREIVTILTGESANSADTEVIVGWLDEHHPDVTVEIHRGGQPLYPYLFGVE